MAHIAYAGNTWDPATDCLINDGWELRTEDYVQDGVPSDRTSWIAARQENGETIEIISDDPVSLLGLTLIWNRWGANWRMVDLPDHSENIPHYENTYNSETDKETRERID